MPTVSKVYLKLIRRITAMPFASNVLTGGALAGMAASSWVGFSAGFAATDHVRE